MPNRIIKESICTSDNLNILTPEVEVFFYRLMVNCDDYGIMDARPSILRAKCFALKLDSVTEDAIEGWLKVLASKEVRLIFLYECDGKRYLKFTNWEIHQQIRAKRSKYPTPDSESVNLISFDINGNHVIANVPENPIQSESKSESEYMSAPDDADVSEKTPAEKPHSGRAQDIPGKGDYTDEFEEFWKHYPRRIEKKAAYRAWKIQLKKKVSSSDMIQAAINYLNYCRQNGTGEQFIKHASTFLGPDKPFEEYINGSPIIAVKGQRKNVDKALELVRKAEQEEFVGKVVGQIW